MKKKFLCLVLVIILLLALSNGCNCLVGVDSGWSGPEEQAEHPPDSLDSTLFPGKLSVHFLDVGQGDAILILFPRGQTMLVDAGSSGAAPLILSYLQQLGVQQIDYLVATHPHQDHIGGMDQVVQSFEIGKVFMPRVTHNTTTFENLLLAVKSTGKKITAARAGLIILEEEDLKAGFVAPAGNDYPGLNNYSAVIYIEYGQTSFLLTGDAEAESEREMISAGRPFKATVLKVGHHGSISSTTLEFLQAVSPIYAVISTGAGNDYGHPHQETLRKLAERDIVTYRTDQDGTIVFTSDKESLSVKTLPSNRP